jgi:MOSC domain-containing protein YiiM
MQTGEVVDIFITFEASSPLNSVPEVRAVPGKGLEGDRYFAATGTFEKPGKPKHPGQELTLIESEAIEALERETTIKLEPGAARRNILTRGIALNHLIGREFQVGEVRVKGIRLCEPCNHLESLTQKGVKDGLVHRGGLRAQILTEGFIRVGDEISVAPDDAAVPVAM